MTLELVDRAHDHARCAVATLQAMTLAKSLLNRMQLFALADALYGGDAFALGLHRKDGARFDGLAIKVDGATTALRGVTADMGASQV